MRKHILALLLVAFFFSASGQQMEVNRQQPEADLLRKSRIRQKIGGAFLLTGLGLCMAGLVIPEGRVVEQIDYFLFGTHTRYKNDKLKESLITAGGAALLASIPFFVLSSKMNKKAKALSGSVHLETAAVTPAGTPGRQTYPALNLRLSL